ncbi:MAG: UDP-N-acetylmuramoyl-tripeptide--D-alanyl-D-alanine ligase [Candidatus Magasanikbacteria bacterium]|nr:UDP-N-acetylmuramoyl-tripeptide--D-alanyl-D-alanine ligase [Candidatus Magasanikbacteria bacterium]
MLKLLLQNILGFLSKAIIKKYRPIVVGITGSVGKTSAKEAVATILNTKFKVRANSKNYNNEIGVPLTIIGGVEPPGRSLVAWLVLFFRGVWLLVGRRVAYPEVLILEMGADKPGDIKYLTTIAPCTVGVLTFISHAHTEFFKTIKRIVQEKRIIISHLPRSGHAIVNYDCAKVMENVEVTKSEVISYGFKDGASVQATDVKVITDDSALWPMGLNFKVSYQGSFVPVFLPGMVAEQSISAALAGLAVGLSLGVNLIQGAEAIRNVAPLAGHLRLIPGIKETLIIDDTYNSSPAALRAALQVLADIVVSAGSERYAVLGDMLELGGETESAHREAGFLVAEKGFDYLITVGEAMKGAAAAAREAGFPEHHIASFNDSRAAGKFLQEKLRSGDVALVKGSQGTRMERIVKEVMGEPLRAGELLVRQSEEWLRK